jgi:hypothetical protein
MIVHGLNTTAEHREAARAAESELDWDSAAFHYFAAISKYPKSDNSELAKRDLAHLKQREQACLHHSALADIGED